MDNLFSRLFADIFKSCETFVLHDFMSLRNQDRNGNICYCLSSCKKLFDETISVLAKARYNGEIILPKTLAFDYKSIFPTENIITNSISLLKKKIVTSDNTIKLSTAREVKEKMRILFIPIDGMASFSNCIGDFSVVLVAQKEDDERKCFITEYVAIFNPLINDIFTFDLQNGCQQNGRKINNDTILQTNLDINAIFVNDCSTRINFDLTKLSQKTTSLAISTSIFSSLVNILTTKNNLCVYKINNEYFDIVNFVIKVANLSTRKVGEHLLIGAKRIIEVI